MPTQPEHRPRATGQRIGYHDLPAALRDHIEATLGPVRVRQDHVGGMSPGCATSLLAADGRTLFVKAVGIELNQQSVELFRQEARLLPRLSAVAYRPTLHAVIDEHDWVALVLDDIPGRYPDLADAADFAAVAQVVQDQIVELTPPPNNIDVLPLAVTANRWAGRWAELRADPARFLPDWAVARFDDLDRRVRDLPDQLPATTLCHFDIRDDNLVLRDDGRAVVVDWGMARLGPEWVDLALLALQKPTAAEAQDWLERWIPLDAQAVVTDLLVAFGGSQAWNAHQPDKPSLPTLAGFCREDADRLLAVARLRLAG